MPLPVQQQPPSTRRARALHCSLLGGALPVLLLGVGAGAGLLLLLVGALLALRDEAVLLLLLELELLLLITRLVLLGQLRVALVKRLLRRDLAVRQGARLGGALLRDHRLALLRELGHLLVLTLHLAEGVLRREGGHPRRR